MLVEMRRRFLASAKSAPIFLKVRLTGRGNGFNDLDCIMFSIPDATEGNVQNTEHSDNLNICVAWLSVTSNRGSGLGHDFARLHKISLHLTTQTETKNGNRSLLVKTSISLA